MNLQQPPNREEKRWLLAVSPRVRVCAFTHTRVDYPASLSARMRGVTQPPPRNPKLGRLVCTRDL